MAYRFNSEKWFDGTHWEVTVPDDWSAGQDKTIDGFPYRFQSPTGSFLQLGVRKFVELTGYADDSISSKLGSEDERRAYLMTKGDAWLAHSGRSPLGYIFALLARGLGFEPKVVKCDAGKLKGYVYRQAGENDVTVQGYFVFRNWVTYVYFHAKKADFDNDSKQSLAILESLQFGA